MDNAMRYNACHYNLVYTTIEKLHTATSTYEITSPRMRTLSSVKIDLINSYHRNGLQKFIALNTHYQLLYTDTSNASNHMAQRRNSPRASQRSYTKLHLLFDWVGRHYSADDKLRDTTTWATVVTDARYTVSSVTRTAVASATNWQTQPAAHIAIEITPRTATSACI
jgi:hypothetical protein